MEKPVVTSHIYKGHTISLIPSREGYMWACQYVIMKSDRPEVDGFAGNAHSSREAAKSAALEKAQTLIDESKLDKDLLEG